jgi:hypothetical protein
MLLRLGQLRQRLLPSMSIIHQCKTLEADARILWPASLTPEGCV